MGQRQQQHLTIFNSVEWLIIFFSVWLEIIFLLPTNWHFDRYKSSSRIMVFSFQHHPVGWEGKFLYGKRNLSMYLLRCNKYDEIISFLNSVSASCAYALAFLKKMFIYTTCQNQKIRVHLLAQSFDALLFFSALPYSHYSAKDSRRVSWMRLLLFLPY